MRSIVLLAVIAITTTSPIQAYATITGQQIIDFGNSYKKSLTGVKLTAQQHDEASYLSGYIGGVLDMTTGLNMYCPPNGFTFGSAIDLTITYAKNHPAELNKLGSDVVLAAMRNSFRCS
ncbi:hypothetical protein HL273_20315 [Yersinia enterocolitica]|uniref:Rap1a/Tai family immunity protein n=1 Tax=Yersinia enterocolitica TaxID=630 RepID=UPI00155B00BA|nr:hypothetical protein [Yersinia enterocolitica]NQS96550.1 hypothetical protein [Yersinia enterocolitica]NQT45615.1 hypothetical protein [Yersinia enterocolitica]NQU02358.1 hypothetical protein [Yersinia enterocolitica]HDL8511499.1 hypothetical protein [Yersinia enterocolitica]